MTRRRTFGSVGPGSACEARREDGRGSALTALLIALALVCLPAAAVGVMLLVAARRAKAAAPTLREGRSMPAPEGGWPRLCVVTPAHNEEKNIAAMARSLLAQDYPGLRLVFALDRCTDGTERVLREATGDARRVEVVKIERCPEEWAGKTHAAWRGVQDSESAKDAELLLFTDADTEHEAGCLRAAVAILSGRGLGLLSVLSTLRHERWFERIVQPICSMELMRHHPLPRVNRADEPRAFANGQFMLFRRDVYESVGAHAGVRAELLEDIALARRVRDAGAGASMLLADGMLSCAMYDDWAEFRRGWKRIYTEAANRKPSRLRRNAWRVRAASCLLPAVALACALLGAWHVGEGRAWGWACVGAGLVPTGLWLLVMGITARAGGGSAWRAPLAGVGAWLTGSILLAAARDLERGRPTSWGGREYAREAR